MKSEFGFEDKLELTLDTPYSDKGTLLIPKEREGLEDSGTSSRTKSAGFIAIPLFTLNSPWPR